MPSTDTGTWGVLSADGDRVEWEVPTFLVGSGGDPPTGSVKHSTPDLAIGSVTHLERPATNKHTIVLSLSSP